MPPARKEVNVAATSAKIIYENLKAFGLTRAQVRKLLPEWWSPEAEKHPDGIAELCALISRRLSLDLTSLLRGEIRRKSSAVSLAYKHSAAATPQSLQGATSIALSLADAVAAAMRNHHLQIPNSAQEFAAIARQVGNGIVGLESLINACWSSGIPIVPMPNLPVGIRKMDGAVIKVGARPIILISKKKSSRAWLGFIVAHEIGHIGCQHLERSGSIIDVSLQEQATYETESTSDIQEREADAFALNLLGGDAVERIISTWPTWTSPAELAVRAREAHADLGVESGHLILRYAFKTKKWPDSMSALNYLSEDTNAEAVMQQALRANLNLDLVADDLKDLVCQITGIEDTAQG
jgi:hypothetical protein